MIAPQILIISYGEDLHTRAVMHILEKNKINVEVIDFSSLNRDTHASIYIDNDIDVRIRLSDDRHLKFSDVDTIWWRRPIIPENNLIHDENIRKYIRGEWEHFIEGLEVYSSCRWINSPSANRLANRKTIQLQMAQEIGLKIPKTIVTNDGSVIKDFLDQEMQLIYKHIGSVSHPRSSTKKILPSDINRLSSLLNCPAIFQERIEAESDIRVTIIGKEIFAVEIRSNIGKSPYDWRLLLCSF